MPVRLERTKLQSFNLLILFILLLLTDRATTWNKDPSTSTRLIFFRIHTRVGESWVKLKDFNSSIPHSHTQSDCDPCIRRPSLQGSGAFYCYASQRSNNLSPPQSCSLTISCIRSADPPLLQHPAHKPTIVVARHSLPPLLVVLALRPEPRAPEIDDDHARRPRARREQHVAQVPVQVQHAVPREAVHCAHERRAQLRGGQLHRHVAQADGVRDVLEHDRLRPHRALVGRQDGPGEEQPRDRGALEGAQPRVCLALGLEGVGGEHAEVLLPLGGDRFWRLGVVGVVVQEAAVEGLVPDRVRCSLAFEAPRTGGAASGDHEPLVEEAGVVYLDDDGIGTKLWGAGEEDDGFGEWHEWSVDGERKCAAVMSLEGDGLAGEEDGARVHERLTQVIQVLQRLFN